MGKVLLFHQGDFQTAFGGVPGDRGACDAAANDQNVMAFVRHFLEIAFHSLSHFSGQKGSVVINY